jgi:hypothetical protein
LVEVYIGSGVTEILAKAGLAYVGLHIILAVLAPQYYALLTQAEFQVLLDFLNAVGKALHGLLGYVLGFL